MLKTSPDLRKLFRYVNQRLGEISVVLKMNWDQLKISRNSKRAAQKFSIARRERS
jgi:hypothetical protein